MAAYMLALCVVSTASAGASEASREERAGVANEARVEMGTEAGWDDGMRTERRRSLGPYTMYEQIIYRAKQERILTWLAHDMNEGRATGTRSAASVARYIERHFEKYGLKPLFGNSFYQPFLADSISGAVGRNVAGIVPSAVPSDKYVIITAHYDHLGILAGSVYNGADDNASGVTVLLNLADMFGTMSKTRTGPDKNIVFVALDAKELNMAGSRYFVQSLKDKDWKDNIICAMNIDQIGTVLEPVHEADTSFVIVLGEQTLRPEDRGKIKMCNNFYNIGLDIDYTFYGSENFTDLFYKLSDQASFHDAGIPALLLTSGFHRHTYKTTDDPDIISWEVMKKRALLIFYLTMML